MENGENGTWAASEQVQPVAPKKQSNARLYAVIAILSVAVVGLAVALVVVLTANNKQEPAATGNAEKPAEKTESDFVAKRDEKRMKILQNFKVGIENYQVNNNGKSPWKIGGYVERKWKTGEIEKTFVQRYIDSNCSKADDDGKYDCSEEAMEFRDPDGSVLNLELMDNAGALLMSNGTNSVNLGGYFEKWPNNHTLIIVPEFYCRETDGVVNYGSGLGPAEDPALKRETSHKPPYDKLFSLLYRLESGKIACVDNY